MKYSYRTCLCSEKGNEKEIAIVSDDWVAMLEPIEALFEDNDEFAARRFSLAFMIPAKVWNELNRESKSVYRDALVLAELKKIEVSNE